MVMRSLKRTLGFGGDESSSNCPSPPEKEQDSIWKHFFWMSLASCDLIPQAVIAFSVETKVIKEVPHVFKRELVF